MNVYLTNWYSWSCACFFFFFFSSFFLYYYFFFCLDKFEIKGWGFQAKYKRGVIECLMKCVSVRSS